MVKPIKPSDCNINKADNSEIQSLNNYLIKHFRGPPLVINFKDVNINLHHINDIAEVFGEYGWNITWHQEYYNGYFYIKAND